MSKLASAARDEEATTTASYARVQTPRASAAGAAATAQGHNAPSPLDSASWLSRISLWWINPLIRHGYAQPLEQHDVWDLPVTDTSQVLQRAFDGYYEQAKRAKDASSESDDAPPSVRGAMWKATSATMGIAIALHLLSAAFTIMQPLLIKAVLQFLQGSQNSFGIESGYALAALLTATTFAGVTTLDYGMYLTTRAGINARMIVVNAVYQKVLRLSSTARHAMNSGDIITLAGVDSERLFEAYSIGMWAVVSPFMILVVCILIAVEMGWYVALAAAAVSALVLGYAMVNSWEVGKCRSDILGIAGERVKVTNEVLQGIRVVKMYAWEDATMERVREIREREIAVIRKYNYLRVNNAVILFLALVFMNAVCLLVFIYKGDAELTVPTAFALLALVNVCKMPFGIFSNAVVSASEAWASTERIAKFLAAEEIDTLAANGHDAAAVTPSSPRIEIRDGQFHWNTSHLASDNRDVDDTAAAASGTKSHHHQGFFLSNINLSIPSGSLTIVVGAVGSGKSSLVNALLGEMHQSRGACVVKGNVAYASQQAWIQHNTVRENILFGTPFDQSYYDQVVSACQLERDLQILENGDATEIGERGINLSGGQKARVSLARVMYRRNADVMILDDPLSALDVHVANSVFFQCVLGLVKDKTRVLVLNSHYHLLRHADRVVVMAGGEIVGDGTYDDVKSTFTYLEDKAHEKLAAAPLPADLEEAMDLVADETRVSLALSETPDATQRASVHRSSAAAKATAANKSRLLEVENRDDQSSKASKSKTMMLEEDRATGSVSWRIYVEFLRTFGANGVALGLVIFFSMALGQIGLVAADYYITFWSNGSLDSLQLSQKELVWIYVAIVAAASVVCYLRSVFYFEVCLRVSKALHAKYFSKVLHAPVTAFFDVTPVGRVLNRFSYDLDQIDNPLPYYSMWLLMFIMLLVSILVVCAVTSPYTLILYAPLAVACYYVQVYYQATSRELKRLDSITRSPFLNLVAETINGIESIRAFQVTSRFSSTCRELLDHNSKFYFMFQTSSKWFTMRLNWLVATVVSVVSFTCIASRESIGAASAGIALTYAIQLTINFQRLMTLASMTENFMTSFERISYYKHLDTEGSSKEITTKPTASWPQEGTIAFENVSLRYRDGLELVLKDVSFSIKDGEKIGVCGRTGSGKSTLMSALFRVVECASGRIVIDGVDISSIKIQELRAKLTIIPQDPVLFSGSLRLNLDPFDEKSDEEVWGVLRKVHLSDDVSKWGQGLTYEVAEKGDNLSVGQRQLVCIARALLRQSRIIVLDEATANVDQELDRLIQVAVKENFQDKTAMTIAHRLETIADSDRILVLDHGEVQEFDSPANLLAKPDGMFASLINSTKK